MTAVRGGVWLLLATLAAALIGWPAADAEAKSRFYGCVQESHGCSHRFVAGDAPATRFKDRRESFTDYRVCVSAPHGGRECARSVTGRRNRPDALSYLPGATGRHVARWYVDGKTVSKWVFRVRPEDA